MDFSKYFHPFQMRTEKQSGGQFESDLMLSILITQVASQY